MGQTNVWIGSNYMMICETKHMADLMLIYIFLSIMLREGGKFTINGAKRCFGDSENCSQVNSFSDSWWKVLSFSYALRAGAFCSV